MAPSLVRMEASGQAGHLAAPQILTQNNQALRAKPP